MMRSFASAFSSTLERALNQALEYDPATRARLATLTHTRIAVRMSSPTLYLRLTVLENGKLHTALHDDEQACDLSVAGSALDFIKMLHQPRHSLADSGIHLSGKVQLLHQLQDIAQQLDIDWEEPLIELLGVVPGHTVATLFRGTLAWGKDVHAFANSWLPELLQEEWRLTPATTELQMFYHEVDELRARTQRLEARLQRIAALNPTATRGLL